MPVLPLPGTGRAADELSRDLTARGYWLQLPSSWNEEARDFLGQSGKLDLEQTVARAVGLARRIHGEREAEPREPDPPPSVSTEETTVRVVRRIEEAIGARRHLPETVEGRTLELDLQADVPMTISRLEDGTEAFQPATYYARATLREGEGEAPRIFEGRFRLPDRPHDGSALFQSLFEAPPGAYEASATLPDLRDALLLAREQLAGEPLHLRLIIRNGLD
jgi:hypothetical protein